VSVAAAPRKHAVLPAHVGHFGKSLLPIGTIAKTSNSILQQPCAIITSLLYGDHTYFFGTPKLSLV
jgi:hypothetical protein